MPFSEEGDDARGATALAPPVVLVPEQDLAGTQRRQGGDPHTSPVGTGERHCRQDRRTRAGTHEGAGGLVGGVQVGCPAGVRERLGDAAHDVVSAGTRADAQPRQVREVLNGTDRGSGIRGDQHPRFVNEWNVRVSAWGQTGVLVAFDDEDVKASRAQGCHAGGLLRFLDAQVDAGQSLLQVGQRRDQGGAADRQECPQCDRACHLAGQWPQGLESFGDVGVDAFAGLGDDGAGGGQDCPGRRALDELEAHFFLKFLDLLRDRRGGDHEDVRGSHDAAFACDRQEERQAARINVHEHSIVK